ncbi:LAFE_0C05864g1_1 [Lachancea fermentati]|uniref:LAFE_0C05864g1_1 n=1 Tax=Lachancea fermentati TaxID=4955 RepID=A0A1G4M9T4_LACFM|nr:LAFE_0C05864g1_1 [Lachancea fermentati]
MTEPAPGYSKLFVLKEYWYGLRPNKPEFVPKDYPDLTGKTALVTGFNAGIGYEVAKLLYSKNCNVIGIVRTETKGLDARKRILEDVADSTGDVQVVGGCELSDLTTIKAVATNVKKIVGENPISIIIHNAGIMPPTNTGTSKQGFDLIFATNVLGPQLLQHFLDPLFLKKDDDLKRIVWVSSSAHFNGFEEYGINWENPTFEGVEAAKRPPATTLYGQSKAANILQAKAWATRHKEIVDQINCVSVSCFPGVLKSELTRDYSSWMHLIKNVLFWDCEYGAYSELYAALSPNLTLKNEGAYIVPFGEIHEPRDDIKVGLTNGTDLKLWDLVESIIGKYF